MERATVTDVMPLRVLFLSPTNAARSQIAEALLSQKGGERFVVASAGLSPAARVHPAAVHALGTLGIDWSTRQPKGLDAVVDLDWDFIIATCEPAKEPCPSLPGQPLYARWGVPNPVDALGETSQEDPFLKTAHLLIWRIDLMLAVRPEVLERAVTAQTYGTVTRARRSYVESAPTIPVYNDARR